MKYFTNEVKIAIVAVIGLVVLFFGLKFLKGLSMMSGDNTYYITFENISGLSVSSPVYADGYKVGVVKEINYDYGKSGHITTLVEIDKELRIPKGSGAEMSSDMLGNVQVNLLLATNPRERMHFGDTLRGNNNPGTLGKFAELLPAVEKMLPKLDSILASVNALLADPALSQTLHNAEAITTNLTTTSKEINTLMATLNKDVPTMTGKLTTTLDNTTQFTDKLSKIDIENTMAKVNSTLADVKQMTDNLNNNQGTLGKLMRDAELYNHLSATAKHADSLVIDLKSHPKRYVHFSIFGKKDKPAEVEVK